MTSSGFILRFWEQKELLQSLSLISSITQACRHMGQAQIFKTLPASVLFLISHSISAVNWLTLHGRRYMDKCLREVTIYVYTLLLYLLFLDNSMHSPMFPPCTKYSVCLSHDLFLKLYFLPADRYYCSNQAYIPVPGLYSHKSIV